MTPEERAARDARRLDGVDPDLRWRIERLLAIMRILGRPMFVTAGVRTDEEQAALYARGRTAAGTIVTHADGVTKRSKHQRDPSTGYGRAVDLAFVPFAETPEADTWRGSWAVFGEAAKALGLTWGGDWSTLPDRPHVELRD